MSNIINITNYTSSDYVNSLKDYCLSKGIDVLDLAGRSGESPDFFLHCGDYVDAQKFNHLHGLMAKIRDVPAVNELLENPLQTALDFAEWCTLRNVNGTLGLAMRCANDFAEAVALLEKYSITRTNSYSYGVIVDNDFMYLRIYEASDSKEIPDIYISPYLKLINMLNGGMFLRRSLSGDISNFSFELYTELNLDVVKNTPGSIGCRIHSGAGYTGIKVPLEFTSRQFSTTNPDLFRRLIATLDEQMKKLPQRDFLSTVRSVIRSEEWSLVSLENTARVLNISVSTLQRRLRFCGKSFKEVRNEERVEQAKEFLSLSDQTLDSIAYRLGFSNSSNFTKSFRSVTGMSPKEYRSGKR